LSCIVSQKSQKRQPQRQLQQRQTTAQTMAENNLLLEPLPFDEPSFLTASRTTGLILPDEDDEDDEDDDKEDDKNNKMTRFHSLKSSASMRGANILCLSSDNSENKKYFFLQRKLNQTGFASVRVGFVVEPKNEDDEDRSISQYRVVKASLSLLPPSLSRSLSSKMTNIDSFEKVAIKSFDRENMDLAAADSTSNAKTTALPAAMTEMAALEMVAKHNGGKSTCHVDYSITMGCDKHSYYAIVPYYGEGTLFQYVAECNTLTEPVARHFFKQIIKGIQTLTEVGLCHRNINLSTIQLRGENCTISELSSCMKLMDNGKNTMFPAHWAQGGNPRYIPPEVVRMENFSGEQADLWAAAICLCQMLWGMEAPFVWASPEDPRYTELCINGNTSATGDGDPTTTTGNGNRSGVPKWEQQQKRRSSVNTSTHFAADDDEVVNISEEGCDIIQNMLRAEPKDRYTLEQVKQHPWLKGKSEPPTFSSETTPP